MIKVQSEPAKIYDLIKKLRPCKQNSTPCELRVEIPRLKVETRNLGVPYFGVLIIRFLLFRVLY